MCFACRPLLIPHKPGSLDHHTSYLLSTVLALHGHSPVHGVVVMGRARDTGAPGSLGEDCYTVYSTLEGAPLSYMGSQLEFTQEQLLSTTSRLLRVLLSSPAPVLHSQLRAKVLDMGDSSETSKCLFEVAVATLSDQGFLLRHGLAGGNTALYSIPEAARSRAEDIAFREFPDDARFVYTASRVAARVPCSLNRRHGSPRQLAARTRGVEKTSGARGRSKRGGDDASQLLQKRKKVDSCFDSPMSMSP